MVPGCVAEPPWGRRSVSGRGRGRGRGLASSALLALCPLLLLQPTSAAPEEKGPPVDKLEGKVTYLWPIHFSSIPLSGTGGKGGVPLEPPEFGAKLADIGLRGFREYLKNTLPRELEVDEDLADMWNRSDHSRVNICFQRWQKRVFVDRNNLPASYLTSKFEEAPRLEGIDYSWPELYESREFSRLKNRIAELAKLYLKRSGMQDVPSKFRIFSWLEVYDKGDALRPDSRIQGAYVAGRYFASVAQGSIKFNFEDPRGINPPFGKTYSHPPFEGNLVMHPVWNSYFVTPNMKDAPAVVFAFLVFPDGGSRADWRQDPTGNITITRSFKVSAL